MNNRNIRNKFIFGNHHRTLVQLFGLCLIGTGLLAACSPAASTQTRAAAADPSAAAIQPSALIPTDTLTATITASPALTATPPLPYAEMQALKDAFYCLTNNLKYAPNIKLTDFCPGYWSSSLSNISKVDSALIRKSLEPYLSPLDSLNWKFTSLTDLKKDERSTSTNQIYTATLSTVLTGDVKLSCPSGSPEPFQTLVNIPINGEVRISVYNYPNQARETLHIESWTIQGKPLEDYCSTLH
jgi:hypothetical protein